MNTKTKELRVDRIEENIAVAYDSDNNEYTFFKTDFFVSEGDIIDAVFDDAETIVKVTVKAEQTLNEKELLKARLSNLFKK